MFRSSITIGQANGCIWLNRLLTDLLSQSGCQPLDESFEAAKGKTKDQDIP